LVNHPDFQAKAFSAKDPLKGSVKGLHRVCSAVEHKVKAV